MVNIVDVNNIGTPKMQKNLCTTLFMFRIAPHIVIASFFAYWIIASFLRLSLYSYRNVILSLRAIKKRTNKKIPKMKQRRFRVKNIIGSKKEKSNIDATILEIK